MSSVDPGNGPDAKLAATVWLWRKKGSAGKKSSFSMASD